MSRRPPVTVVVPFGGDVAGSDELVTNLSALELGPDDRLVLADNTPNRLLDALDLREGWEALPASGERSSYHARNVAAHQATTPWLLFLDSDCRPEADLVERYFDVLPGARVGVRAGRVLPGVTFTLAERFAAARETLDQLAWLQRGADAFAATANLLVRRKAFEQLGGFCEGVRSGGDADLGWRLLSAGWKLDYCPTAVVEHRHRATVPGLLRQRRTYGSGEAWVHRRKGRPAPVRSLVVQAARAGVELARSAARGDGEAAAFAGLDLLGVTAFSVGYAQHNRPAGARPTAPSGGTVVVRDEAHHSDDPAGTTVEAARRPPRPEPWRADPTVLTHFAEDDGHVERLLILLRMLVRAPLRTPFAARRRPLLELAPPAYRVIVAATRPPIVERGSFAEDVCRLAEIAGLRLTPVPSPDEPRAGGSSSAGAGSRSGRATRRRAVP